MTRKEAAILAEYAGIAFYIPNAQPGLVGDYVCLVRKGDNIEDEGEQIGPNRFHTKWDALEFRSLLNETYQKGLQNSLSGKFYAKSARVYLGPEDGCAHCKDEGEYVLGRLFSAREAEPAAEALNLVLKMGKDASLAK